MKDIPTIQKYMTNSPHAVGVDQPLTLAHSIMKTHQIRHLPVLNGGTLVGLLSDRDVNLIGASRDAEADEVTVEEAMSTSVYAVPPGAPLDEVVTMMAERKYGCAVVMDRRQVVGMFTSVDACRTLGEVLRTQTAK